jgi:hypothetical protein
MRVLSRTEGLGQRVTASVGSVDNSYHRRCGGPASTPALPGAMRAAPGAGDPGIEPGVAVLETARGNRLNSLPVGHRWRWWGASSHVVGENKELMLGSRRVPRCAAVVAASAGLFAFSPVAAEAGLAIVIGGSGRVRPGERLVYRIDFRHAYDPRPLNGIAPGDHVSVTLFPPACEQFCVVKRLSRGISVPRNGRMHFSFRFPREYTVCSRASGTRRACHRMRWQSGDRGILGITVHGFSKQCPFGSCRRSGSKTIVVR